MIGVVMIQVYLVWLVLYQIIEMVYFIRKIYGHVQQKEISEYYVLKQIVIKFNELTLNTRRIRMIHIK